MRRKTQDTSERSVEPRDRGASNGVLGARRRTEGRSGEPEAETSLHSPNMDTWSPPQSPRTSLISGSPPTLFIYHHSRLMSTMARGQVYVNGEFSSLIRTARAGCAVVHARKRSSPSGFMDWRGCAMDWRGCAITPPRWWKLASEKTPTPHSCRAFFSLSRLRQRLLLQSPHHPRR